MWKFLKNLFSGGIGSAFSSGIGALIGRLVLGKDRWNSYLDAATGAQLTGAQEQQNEYNALQAELSRGFTAEQAEISRDFNAEQAAIQRDWQAQMDNTKYQRTMDDMRAAGLNPALMYGGASVSSPPAGSAASSSVASGASASGGLPSPSNLGALLQLMQLPLTFRSLKADVEQKEQNVAESKQKVVESKQSIEESKSRTALNEVNAQIANKELSFFEVKTQAQLDDIYSAIRSREVSNRLAEQGISESKARETLALNNATLAEMDAKTRERVNELAVEIAELQKEGLSQENSVRVKRAYAEIAELYGRTLVEKANAGLLNEETLTEAERRGLIKQQTRTEQENTQYTKAATTGQHISNQRGQFVVDHQEMQLMIENGVDITRAIGTFATGAAAGVIAADKVIPQSRSRIGF